MHHAQYNGLTPQGGASPGMKGPPPLGGGSQYAVNGQGSQYAEQPYSGSAPPGNAQQQQYALGQFSQPAPFFGQQPLSPGSSSGFAGSSMPAGYAAGVQLSQQMGSLAILPSSQQPGPPASVQPGGGGSLRPPSFGGAVQPPQQQMLGSRQQPPQFPLQPGQQQPFAPGLQQQPRLGQDGQPPGHGVLATPMAGAMPPQRPATWQPQQPTASFGGSGVLPPAGQSAYAAGTAPPTASGQLDLSTSGRLPPPSQQLQQQIPVSYQQVPVHGPAPQPSAGGFLPGQPLPALRPGSQPPGPGGPPGSGYGAGFQSPPGQFVGSAGLQPPPMAGGQAGPPSATGYAGALPAAAAGGGALPPYAGYSGSGPPLAPAAGYGNAAPSAPGYGGVPPAAGYASGAPPGQGGAPPGQGGAPPGYGYGAGGAPPGSLPPSAPKRLDPDQMPSPIQVIMDDRKSRHGKFQTGARGLVPPLVTTDFVVEDFGNCNPRYMRSTMYSVPVSNDMMKQAKVPFGLVVSPYARLAAEEIPPPCANLGDLGPVRCNRCRAYMCSFMQFVDGGRRFMCPFCNAVTDVPQDYFAHLDHTGKRVDACMRPELCLGSYEVLATKEYCKNGVFPTAPAFIFMIDVSYNSVKSGLLYLLCQHIKDDILPNLPKEHDSTQSQIRVGFVTYSNVLHFYNVRGSLTQPQMMVVSDVEDVFVPMIDGFLVKPSEAAGVIESLLQQLPTLFAEARETEVVLGPVIQAGMDALKSAGCPGKLFIFHTSLPIANAPGKLKNRDDRKLLGTDKEKTILTPQDGFYTKLGQECTAAGCGVDLFLFPNSYIDVATLAEVPRLTGGQVFKYEYFQADINGDRFIQDLINAVQKPIAFDCVLRVRTSTGIRPVDFFGNFHMSNTTDVEMAVLDCDKSFCCEVKHDDKLNENDGAFVQVALLFTSMSGHRKLRVHNLSLNCCSQMSDLFRSCELDTLVNLVSKMALRNTLLKSPKDVREEITVRCCEILAAYRKYCATSSAQGQLILPECMKLLPLYSNCIIRSDALQGAADVSTDDRSYLMHLVNGMDVGATALFFYPRLIPLHAVNVADPADLIPDPIRCSIERLASTGVYLLENGISMFLWIGVSVSQEIVEDLFGVAHVGHVDTEKSQLPEVDSDLSRRVRSIVSTVRQQRQRYMKLTLVRQRDKLEPWFQHFLVEDKDTSGGSSYVDFLCHVHREIRNLLN